MKLRSILRRTATSAALLLGLLPGAVEAGELYVPVAPPTVVAEAASARVLGLSLDAAHRSLLTYEDLSLATEYETLARAVGADGSPVGDAVFLSGSGSFALDNAVSAAVAGGFVAVWEDADSFVIRQRRFAADGTPAGPAEEVSGIETGGGQSPAVTSLPGGGWLAAWVEFPIELGECCGIYARRYLPDGTAAGPAFLLHSDPSALPQDLALASNEQGKLVLVWTAAAEVNAPLRLRALRLDASGAPVGSLLEVWPERGDYSPAFPDAAVAPNGDFLLTWQAAPYGTFLGQIERVEGRGYRADGTPASDLVAYQPAGTRNEPYPGRNPSLAALPDGRFALGMEVTLPHGDPLLPESRPQVYLLTVTDAAGEVESIREVGPLGGSRPEVAAEAGSLLRVAWFGPPAEGADRAVVVQDLAPVCSGALGDICLQDGRFRVAVSWETGDGARGIGTPRPLTAESAAFWFFREENLELFVKVLDACDGYDRYWVFLAGLTNVAVDITVTDTLTGESRTYSNPQKTPFQPIYDTQAFATCGAGTGGS